MAFQPCSSPPGPRRHQESVERLLGRVAGFWRQLTDRLASPRPLSRVCDACAMSVFVDGRGRACVDCNDRVCSRCGVFMEQGNAEAPVWRCRSCRHSFNFRHRTAKDEGPKAGTSIRSHGSGSRASKSSKNSRGSKSSRMSKTSKSGLEG